MTEPALDRLAAITADLEGYIARRATELAAPAIKAAREAAAAEVAQVLQQLEIRSEVLEELRRLLWICEKQLDGYHVRLGEPRDPYVVERLAKERATKEAERRSTTVPRSSDSSATQWDQ